MRTPRACRFLLVAASLALPARPGAETAPAQGGWQDTFSVPPSDLASSGKTRYLVLEPGYQLVLEGREGRHEVTVTITVLDQTRKVEGVETRVVEERETKDGSLVEVSRNFLAISRSTGDVFYFGEEVDLYKDGQPVEPEDAWLAGSKGARFGLLMPGSPRVGQRHYQELAPGTAMDRAEVVSLTETLSTPAGSFEGCLKVEETSPLEPDEKEYKLYAPEVGLIQDGSLRLIRFGTLEKP